MALLSNFIFASDQLVKYYAAAKEIPESSHTLSTLMARKGELQELWISVKSAYESCARSDHTLDGTESLDMTLIDSKFRLCNETYILCLGFLLDQDEKLRPTSSVSKKAIEDLPKPVESTSHCIQVPPCDTETFHGNYLSWPSFRDMFNAIYRQHSKLDNVQKLFHLRSKTDGEAHNIVAKFPLTNSSFELAWEALRSTYENTRLLVNNQVKIIFNLPTMHEETARAIKALQSTINDCLTALQTHKVLTNDWDPILVFACSNRLHSNTLALWEQSIQDPTAVPTWSQMNKFLSARYQVLESIADVSSVMKPNLVKQQSYNKLSPRPNKHVNTYLAKNSFSCQLCGVQHPLRECSEFKKMNVASRTDFVLKNNFCLNCLAFNHRQRDCSSKFTCHTCQGKHHSMLHSDENSSLPKDNNGMDPALTRAPDLFPSCVNSLPVSSQLQSTSPSFIPQVNSNSYFTSNQKRVLLATALVQIVHHGVSHTVRALIDPGSEVSFIASSIQNRLRLPVCPINSTISGINSSHAATSNKLCTLNLVSKEIPQTTICVQAIVLKNLTDCLPSASFHPIELSELLNLQLADPTYHQSSHVDLLLGADLYPTIIREGVKRVSDTMVAQNTIFGWVLSGPLPTKFSSFRTSVAYEEDSLDEQLSKFWEIEEVHSMKTFVSQSDQYCEEFYRSTTYRRPDGRFVVRLPFRPEFPSELQLGRSRNIALKQYIRSEKSLSKNEELQIQYAKVISDYLMLNHMCRVNPEETIKGHSMFSFYLPHHAVIKPESASTKVRVVFNASNASSNGNSLNDLLYPGPTLQRDLTSLIIRWRFFRFVFNGDIEKMYRQIFIHPDDAPFQRILFRRSTNVDIEDFELQTVTFGVNCAPYLALRTLLQLADEQAQAFPNASKIIKSDFYVDDVLSGAHDLNTAKAHQVELINLLRSAGFLLRKWTSNSKYLLEHLPQDHLLSDHFLTLDNDSAVKTLGVRWNAKEDYFYFIVQKITLSESPTKREMLSQIARLFDPAGWLAPVIITSKILMQQTWLDKTSWDECLSRATCLRWIAFVEALPSIQSIKIPRWVDYCPSSTIQLHGFCDSSEKAYSAALYIRICRPDGTIETNLLCAKTKVAPVKPLSLPRLELCGAVLLSKLIKHHLKGFPINAYQLFLWSDSSIVLAWLRKPPGTWKTFVANRTAEIIDNVGTVEWRHVQSSENPADLATRGMSPCELEASALWWKGPFWLGEPEHEWPTSSPGPAPEEFLEVKPPVCLATQHRSDILDRFSSLPRALRILSYVFRFFHRCYKASQATEPNTTSTPKTSTRTPGVTPPLLIGLVPTPTRAEILFVKSRLVLLTQRAHFHREYQALAEGKRLHSKSSLLALNPMLGSDQLLRVNGRLSNAILPYNERHPIILPYSSHLSRLIVSFVHQISLHGANSLMLRLIRQEFWIPKLKNLIRFHIRGCKTCILYNKRVRQQIMAALPVERCSYSPPFTFTGVDFAGPFDIKSFSGRNFRMSKGYACLFVCFSTKAIHLEAASDLSSQVFLAAFARFVARRGLPQKMVSDHGTNFVGANTILQRDFEQLLGAIASQTCARYAVQGLTWQFIPPGAPHMGGLWEAGVKSFKAHFRKIAGSTRFTFEEFATLLCRIEGCLNSRPISPLSENPADLLALTPGHFLRGGPLLSIPEPNLQDSSLSLINRWERVKSLQQEFCQRWKDEYLRELQKRYKWQHPEENVKINDLVVIKNENLPPNEWRLGRVIRVCPGQDGRVRVAVIKTQMGDVTRPITKLCVIPSV